jgi:hypothetical protein
LSLGSRAAGADIALLEDAVLGEQFLDVIAYPRERVEDRPDVVEKLRRQVRQTPSTRK